jgi:hypothetical protein
LARLREQASFPPFLGSGGKNDQSQVASVIGVRFHGNGGRDGNQSEPVAEGGRKFNYDD